MSLRSFMLASALLAPAASAQSPEETAVRSVIDRMFNGMRAADSATVRSVFVDGARFASLDTRSAPPIVRYDSVGGWLRGIANSARRWDEQIYDVQVRVDGEVAQVWAPYTFYLDKHWRHCGTNTMELLKVGADWKITQLSDTRRREGCRDPLGTGPAPAPVLDVLEREAGSGKREAGSGKREAGSGKRDTKTAARGKGE